MKIVRVIVFCLFVIACEEDELPLNNDQLIFRQAFQIHIPPYNYISNGINYLVRGDTSLGSDLTDTLSNSPSFKWDSIPGNLITVAVFINPIEVENSEIANIEDIVWQWHSGMNIDNDGFIQFSEGRNVINSIIDYENSPIPLEVGHYYWAVWGWDPSGVWIWYSSKQQEFYVSE